jgi:hypothetical protein
MIAVKELYAATVSEQRNYDGLHWRVAFKDGIRVSSGSEAKSDVLLAK